MTKKIKEFWRLFLKHKKLAIGLGLFLAVCMGFLLAFLIFRNRYDFGKKVAVSLPDDEKRTDYIQTAFIDFDADKINEAVVIYHDSGDESAIYRVYFSVLKLNNGSWQSLVEQELEGFSTRDKSSSLIEIGKMMSQFELLDLTSDGIKDVWVKTRAEGSGGFLSSFIWGFYQGKGDFLWLQPPTPKGDVAIEGNKILFIEPIYEEDDPNCCPSFWVKSWWQWQENSFIKLGSFIGTDFDEVKAKTEWSTENKSLTLDSRWVHPADEAFKGVIEMWTDGTFTFSGLKSADFSSGGKWWFNRSTVTLEFTQDKDYWQDMFEKNKDFTGYYEDILMISFGDQPTVEFDVDKCQQLQGKSCINFFNWLFYKESATGSTKTTSSSKTDEALIWDAVYDYAPKLDLMSPSLDFKLVKIVGNYALVQVIPGGDMEGAGMILEKIGDQWLVQDFGTSFPEWEKKVPALFQW